MASAVPACRPVREWLSQLDDPRSPLVSQFRRLYGAAGPAAEALRLCRRTLEAFAQRWDTERRVLVVRSTGRVNLLGMHIDHRGGSVNPIAIRELFWVAEPREDDGVVLRNIERDSFPDEEFSIGTCLPKRLIHDWDTWCHDEFAKRRDDPRVTWSNYARAAVLYLQHVHRLSQNALSPTFHGMNVMVGGNIPRAAGLSSSSAIVVAAALACLRIQGMPINRAQLVDWCGQAEWYVGTRGGAGDHAAILFGEAGAVAHITAFPMTVRSIPFPDGYCVVLANSLVEASKRTHARDVFNSRVAAYVFGLLLIRRHFPAYANRLDHLRDLNPTTLGVEDIEIYNVLRFLPERITRAQLRQLLPEHREELHRIFRSHQEPPEGYPVRSVCLYGVAECLRAEMAVPCLERGDIRRFGELITLSHDGDRVTILSDGQRVPWDNRYPDGRLDHLMADCVAEDPRRRERSRLWRQPGGYGVSTPELDELVDLSLATLGVLGAGRVGAGLGGSIIALTEQRTAEELVERLKADYYRPRNLPERVEIVTPVAGACFLDG